MCRAYCLCTSVPVRSAFGGKAAGPKGYLHIAQADLYRSYITAISPMQVYQGGIGSYALLVMVAAFLLGTTARRSWLTALFHGCLQLDSTPCVTDSPFRAQASRWPQPFNGKALFVTLGRPLHGRGAAPGSTGALGP